LGARGPVAYVLVALVAFALGAGVTYLALRPMLTQSNAAKITVGQTALDAGNAAFNAKQWPRAIESYNLALVNGLDDPDIRTDLGTAYRLAGQPQKAISEYVQAQKENPQHQESLFNQAIVYAADLHDAKQGIALWQEYLRRFPTGQYVSQAKSLITQAQAPGGLAPPPKRP